MPPNEKGQALEIAVHAIETVILESSPSLRGQPFELERRKILTVGDVHHEIDIYTKVGAATGYESVFIFECKNWEAPVSKNELIIFSEKIDVAVAQRGYFVAKNFTKDALAQAAKDPRVTILYATEHDSANVPPPESFHITAQASVKCSTTFRVAGTTGTKLDVLHVEGKLVQLGGNDVLLTDYLHAWLDDLYAQRLPRFYTADLPEGVHSMPEADERSFPTAHLFIDERQIERARLEAEFGVEIIRPAVISDYEIATRGRVIRLAKAKVGDFAVETAFVSTVKD